MQQIEILWHKKTKSKQEPQQLGNRDEISSREENRNADLSCCRPKLAGARAQVSRRAPEEPQQGEYLERESFCRRAEGKPKGKALSWHSDQEEQGKRAVLAVTEELGSKTTAGEQKS
jgi:hypothetical protein